MTSLWSYLNHCRCNTSPGALEPNLALANCSATSTFECLVIAIDPKDWPDAAGASTFSQRLVQNWLPSFSTVLLYFLAHPQLSRGISRLYGNIKDDGAIERRQFLREKA